MSVLIQLLAGAAAPTSTESAGDVSSQAQILAVVVAVLFLGLIVELVRRRKLQERYTVVWFLAGIALLALALVPGLLRQLADLAGIAEANTAMFTLILFVAGLLLLNLTTVVSRQAEQITRLSQELAMLRSDGEESTQPSAPPPEVERPPEP